MKGLLAIASALALAVVVTGCGTGYVWRSSVPAAQRTISVPTFRNSSEISELGALSTRQVLRELQREGTFKIRPVGESVLEIQGEIKGANSSLAAYDRRSGFRKNAHDLTVLAEISVVDKINRKVLINNRQYVATTTFAAGEDLGNAKRDASHRAADELARQVVDDVLNLKW